MNIEITPSKLFGDVYVPCSKSIAHRLLISAALADGNSIISNISFNQDIIATINCLKAFGADITVNETSVSVNGIKNVPATAVADCCESGSTLRFLIPLAAALEIETTFIGKGKLPERPIAPYLRELSAKNIYFTYNNTMPFSIRGKLSGGTYKIEGNISSQFITGLLFALPLCEEDSEIILTSPLESKPYVNITIDCLAKSGIAITEKENGYLIIGRQKYHAFIDSVEGDYSQAAFFFTANVLGSNINLKNLSETSLQGDKQIIEIIDKMRYTNSNEINIDVMDIPDLVPILAVLSSLSGKNVNITNAHRLKIKESNRLVAIADALNKIGGKVTPLDDKLIIKPVKSFTGGTVESYNDHRIVMAAAIAATTSTSSIIITNAEAVNKSYPDFFNDFNRLGGHANVINI